jgi:hypothetical protein
MNAIGGLDRRRFLEWSVLGCLCATLAACDRHAPDVAPIDRASEPLSGEGAHASRPIETRDPAQLVDALRRRFAYLELDEEGVRHYCRDYLRHIGPPRTTERDFFSRFLLSSDFFANGSEEGRNVRYVALYDPYLNPCANPFARLEV